MTSTAAKGWLTVREAAEYLQVSEPTIFRWMKQGLLSFYKVGGSTRFSKEGLDAVAEKTTGTKEAEAAFNRCAACGHHGLVDGRLQGAGKLYFKAEKTRFWVFDHSLIPSRARCCPACGHIQIFADTGKLHRLTDEDRDEGDSD